VRFEFEECFIATVARVNVKADAPGRLPAGRSDIPGTARPPCVDRFGIAGRIFEPVRGEMADRVTARPVTGY
jgi:hypothetical protein